MIFLFEVIQATLSEIFKGISMTLVKVFFAITIFLVGFIIGKLLGRILLKFLNEIELNKWFRDSLHLKVNAEHILSDFLSYFIYFIALIAALEEMGVANVVLYILSISIVILILISFFLAVRDIIPNFIAGLYLYSRENLKQNSRIEIDEIKGELVHIDLFHIKIKTKKGDLIYIPNSRAMKSKIIIKKS